MKKFGTRLISAVLAGCMMTSVLPVSAFALEGSAEFEGNVSAQENSDAPAEPSGEVAAACPLTGGETINKKFIEEHGGSKVYSISGTYTEGIVIDAEDEDVVINVTAETTFDKGGNKDDYANFITVRNAKSVTVNAEGQTIKTAEGGLAFSRCFYAENSFTGTAELNGGTYNWQCNNSSACYLLRGNWTFDHLTMNAVWRAIDTDGANVTVEGGTYDCSYSTSATFWIQNSPSSSFKDVTASGAGWVLNAIDNSVVNVDGGSYFSNEGVRVFPDRPTLRASNNATLNVTNADVTGTYCDVFVLSATANLFGGTYTNTNQYLDSYCTSPALKVWENGTLSVNGATVECRGGNAAISSGEPAGSKHCYDQYDNGGKLVVENCTIKNSKYGIYLGPDSSTSAELKSATFENNESDIYLDSGKEITISDTFTTPATIKVADPKEGRQLTVAGNANKLNLVSQDGYRVAYKKVHHYYYLTNLEPRYTLTPEGATATIKNGDDVIELTPNDEIAEGTPVTLTAHAGDGLEFAGWTVTVNGVVLNDPRDLLKFPNEGDQTKATFDMPAGDVKVRAEYNTVDLPVDPVDPVNPVDPVDPVLPGVIIGGAVILGAYETGTGIYRLMNMQGLPLPSDRIELAELVWERAGKPEPQNMTDENLYADIDADDTDAQKAAHWMVEQELMKFDEDNNKFHPCFPVSKLRVCLTWQNAKDKGLID